MEGIRKYAVHFRLDTAEDGHEHTVAGLDGIMAECLLEAVRVTFWQNRMSRYYITDERGPKYAQMWAVITGADLVYHGPI